MLAPNTINGSLTLFSYLVVSRGFIKIINLFLVPNEFYGVTMDLNQPDVQKPQPPPPTSTIPGSNGIHNDVPRTDRMPQRHGPAQALGVDICFMKTQYANN